MCRWAAQPNNTSTSVSNRQSISRWRLGFGVLLALAVPAGLGRWRHSAHPAGGAAETAPALRELTLAELVRRDGRLYAPGESTPFDGVLHENFSRFVAGKIVERKFFSADKQAAPAAGRTESN